MARALVETRPLFKVTTLGERRGRPNDDFFFNQSFRYFRKQEWIYGLEIMSHLYPKMRLPGKTNSKKEHFIRGFTAQG